MVVQNSYLIDAYAEMSDLAYDNTGETVFGPNGQQYVPFAFSENDQNGFQAWAFFNTTTRELVFAFAGTEGAYAPFPLTELARQFLSNVSRPNPKGSLSRGSSDCQDRARV